MSLFARAPANGLVIVEKESAESSHDGNGIVVEDGRDVFRGKLVGGVTDKEARLADSTVTDDNTSVGSWLATGFEGGGGLATHFIVATTILKELELARVDVEERYVGLLRRGVEMQVGTS